MAVVLPNFNGATLKAESLEITIVNQQSKYTLSDSLEINMQVQLPGDAKNIAWKFLKPSETTFFDPLVSSNVTLEGLTTYYKFVPMQENCQEQGTYAFVVKYRTNDGEQYTKAKFINIELEKIQNYSGLTVNEFVVKNSKSNLQAYKFTVVGLKNNLLNTNDIIWYVGPNRYATGDTFIFEPDYAGTYRVRAVVNINGKDIGIGEKEVTSVVVNPKLQIIVASIIGGILILSLIIGIIINRKSERIW